MKFSSPLLSAACGLALTTLALGGCTTAETTNGTSTTAPVRTMQNNASITNNRDVTTPGTGTPTAPANVQPMTTDADPNSSMKSSSPATQPTNQMHNNANISNNRDVMTPGTGTPAR